MWLAASHQNGILAVSRSSADNDLAEFVHRLGRGLMRPAHHLASPGRLGQGRGGPISRHPDDSAKAIRLMEDRFDVGQ